MALRTMLLFQIYTYLYITHCWLPTQNPFLPLPSLMEASSAHVCTRPGLTKLGQCMAIPCPLLVTAQELGLRPASPWQAPGNHVMQARTCTPSLPARWRGKTCIPCLGISFLFFFPLDVKKGGSSIPTDTHQEGTGSRTKPIVAGGAERRNRPTKRWSLPYL